MVETRSRGTPRAAPATANGNGHANGHTNGHAKKATPTTTGFTHTPTALTLLWLAVSVTLVAWDTGYVLLRPWSMKGGPLHWPLWVPYDLYGRIDSIYGWKAYNERDGFTAAQSWLNVVESAMYIFYGLMYVGSAVPAANGSWTKTLHGRAAAITLLVGYTGAVATVSKTALYCEFETCSPDLPVV
jgi:hypothetical protein